MQVRFKKLNKDVIGIKEPAISGDAGYDLYCSEKITIAKKSAACIKTGVCLQLPPGYWLEIMPKSGLATKHSISVHNGVIDNGYRGEIVVYVYNHGDNDYTFEKNDKVAQAVIRQLIVFELAEVDELTDSKRGTQGFGSTGK